MADLIVTAGNVLAGTNAVTKSVTWGETITAGLAVYKDATSGRYKKASTASAALAAIEGISLNGGANGQPGTIVTSGNLNPGATVSVGSVYVASDTVGNIATSADNSTGDYRTIIGIGTTASNIAVNIQAGGVAMA